MRSKTWQMLLLSVIFVLTFGFSVQAQDSIVTPAGELPIVTEPVTLTILLGNATGNVVDYNTNAFTLWVEEQTGIDLDIQVGSSEMLNVTLASGDLPDVIAGLNLNASLLAQQGAEGQFLPLNDLIEQYGFETTRIFYEERPHYLPLITSPDNNIYGLPSINECFQCNASQKGWVYQPWLDALGLEVPTTTEEFRDMLIAFRDQDPNGNGLQDEIPASGTLPFEGWHTGFEEYVLNAFVYFDRLQYNISGRLLLQDGTIQAAYAQPGYQEGMAYIADLYAEGLIDPNAFLNTNDAIRQIGNNPDVNILGFMAAGWPGQYIDVLKVEEGGRLEEWVAIPPLEGPNGYRTTPYAPFGFGNPGSWVITSAAEHPEVAFRLADFLYSQEATLRSNLGVLDVDWTWSAPGEVSITGEQALYTLINYQIEGVQNQHWAQAGINYRPSELRTAQAAAGDYVEGMLYRATNDLYMDYVASIDDVIPPLVFSEDQSGELADLELAINTYVDEMFVRFATGDADIIAEWDNYLATLDSVGLPRFLEIVQEAYDARSGA